MHVILWWLCWQMIVEASYYRCIYDLILFPNHSRRSTLGLHTNSVLHNRVDLNKVSLLLDSESKCIHTVVAYNSILYIRVTFLPVHHPLKLSMDIIRSRTTANLLLMLSSSIRCPMTYMYQFSLFRIMPSLCWYDYRTATETWDFLFVIYLTRLAVSTVGKSDWRLGK